MRDMSNNRIASFLNAASGSGIGLSEGSVYGFCRKFAKNAGKSIGQLEKELLNQTVVSTDAAAATVNWEQKCIRNFSTGKTVVYRAIKEKNN